MRSLTFRFHRFPFLLVGLQALCCGTFWVGAPPLYAADQQVPKSPQSEAVAEDPLLAKGAKVYQTLCASCHGKNGEGVKDHYSDALIGDSTIGELTRVITETMPEGKPEACVGEDAKAVAAYIHYAFYSEAAQIRNRPPRIGLARLTGDQLRQSLADLYAAQEGLPSVSDRQGIKGIYFDGDRWKNENKKIDRIDPTLDFDFGRKSPGEGIQPESFYIYWEGSLKVDVSGEYEIIVRSTCSFVMDFGKLGRKFIDNHVQSGDKTEFRQRLQLTAGRLYPFKIDFIQRKRKTELPPAKVSLSWIPPYGSEEIIPTRNLVSYAAPPTFSLQTILPPDDRSYGYERGISVSRQWDESTTAAALEFAQIAVDELWPRYLDRHKKDSDDNRGKLRGFLKELIEVAFRGPLDTETQTQYIDNQIKETPDDGEAIKRVVLVSLKSPRFLYPGINPNRSLSQRNATRLALILFDSLPSESGLRKEAAADRFVNDTQIRKYVQSRMNDYRVQAKTRDLMYEWLNLERIGDEISKNETVFKGFDRELISDLRGSLDAFLDDVVSSKESDYRQLFLADWVYTTDRLAEFYGDAWRPAGEGSGLRKSRPDGKTHHGVITHPLLMSGLSYYDTTSPIHRGVFLIRFVLGRTLKPPAEAFAPLSPDLHPQLTTRERVELQTSPQACQACHLRINGLGFTLEHFDPVGRFRERDREKPINAVGSYIDRDGKRVEFTNATELASYLAISDDARLAFISRAFQHFVKQPVAAFGPDMLERLDRLFVSKNFSIRELIVEIAVIGAQREP